VRPHGTLTHGSHRDIIRDADVANRPGPPPGEKSNGSDTAKRVLCFRSPIYPRKISKTRHHLLLRNPTPMTFALTDIIPHGSAEAGLATISLAVVLGLALGALRVRGIRLGVSGVLFSALLLGQQGFSVDPKTLEFLRDFALILFVYAIGLQVGPGFLDSLRREGLRLNTLSLCVIVLGALMTWGVVRIARLPRESASGLYAGAFTTTPGLAAGQESLRHSLINSPDRLASAMNVTSLAYTVAYPFGILGPILVIALLRRLFNIHVDAEREQLLADEQTKRPPIEVLDVEVTRQDHAGVTLKDHPLLRSLDITFSRLHRNNVVTVPTGDTAMQVGDIYRAVGPRTHLAELVAAVGRKSRINLGTAAGDVQRMELVVTNTQVLRRPLRELDLIRRTGVTLARVTRSGVDLVSNASLRLHFGDHVVAVGPSAGLKKVEEELGNSAETLNRPQLIPIFLGIVLGVVIGGIPLAVPGMSLRLRIGLAGGPMLAAILLSQLGNMGSLVWYMPAAANQLFRDFGLAVFLACVGLQSGDHFLQRLSTGGGVFFVIWGAIITTLPVLLVGIIARKWMHLNFLTLSGWVSGAMTSSPSLLFASELGKSDAPALAYAAVAPLGMLAPILCAQLLVVMLG
jgi:putative transport protein